MFPKLTNLGNIDSYGRKKKKDTKQVVSELKSFYDIESETAQVENRYNTTAGSKSSHQDAENRLDYLTRLSRGEIMVSSSGSEGDENDSIDSSTSMDQSDGDHDDESSQIRANDSRHRSPLDIPVGVDDDHANDAESDIEPGTSTSRLAVLHCDWSHMKAADIM